MPGKKHEDCGVYMKNGGVLSRRKKGYRGAERNPARLLECLTGKVREEQQVL